MADHELQVSAVSQHLLPLEREAEAPIRLEATAASDFYDSCVDILLLCIYVIKAVE